jgi:hypothetical protein
MPPSDVLNYDGLSSPPAPNPPRWGRFFWAQSPDAYSGPDEEEGGEVDEQAPPPPPPSWQASES